MGRIEHWMLLVALAIVVVSGVSAGDWNGFHGLEKAGRADSGDGPVDWSASRNVAWKTAIPGRGHSSPILSGNAVYVTTTYESPRQSSGTSAWNHVVLILLVLSTMSGVVVAVGNVKRTHRRTETLWLHARLLLFTQVLVGIAVVVFIGRALLNPEGEAVRFLLISIVLALSCLMLGVLFTPWRSHRQLLTSLLSFAVAVAAFIILRYKGLALPDGSLKGMLAIAILVSPVVLGSVLLLVYRYARRRRRAMVQEDGAREQGRLAIWPFVMTAGIGCVTAFVPFALLLYRAAGYQMPDSYVWETRVRPEAGWWWVAAYIGLALVVTGACVRSLFRGRVTRRLPYQRIFLGLAVMLGGFSFVRINLSESPREFIRAVMCLSQDRGEILWTCESLLAPERADSKVTTHASATPATDGERVYAYFGEDGLVCVSREGELLWKRTAPLFRCKFGVGTSPVVKDGILVIVSDVKASDDLPSFIAAFDGLSGAPLWKTERKSHPKYATYSTPLIRTLDGREVVIVRGWYGVAGYDLRTGKELWSFPLVHEGMHLVASLICDDERLYVVDARRLSALSLSDLDLGSDPVVWSVSLVGEKSSTPILAEGFLMVVTEAGIAACLNARTGELLWKERLKGRYYSSLLVTGDRVLFTSDAGVTTAVALEGEFRSVAVNTVDEPVYASLVPQGGCLYIRSTRHLYGLQDGQ